MKLNGQPTSYKELRERHRNVKLEDFSQLILVCGNCGHKDLLANFTKKRESRGWETDMGGSWSLTNKPPTSNLTKEQKASGRFINAILTGDKKDLFFCPKCNSSLVSLDKDYTKQNMMKVL